MGSRMRLQGWDVALAGIIKDRRDTPFVWGQHDCCLFAADCALAITGIDFAADFRGRYDSSAGAARLIAERGGFAQMITGLLGDEIPLNFASRGDVVMIDHNGRPALAVCMGAYLVAAGHDGLVRVSTADGVAAWRVK